ncbi:eukaryotic translation initiation factor 5B-like isoform X2 [Phoenix dactylifera]|uniref:Eukaryotic translation initiation factor 5B-like isoform X2 n=1 Tax=Phoenix dactylifera TaxID=42345 RepID=A0A8B8J7G9_PHODC|nr:eukaryotic translation initiation factor 5B-like isoform X2 [Phoenix dactylifera]
MDGFGASAFSGMSAVMKKRRSATSRRPRLEAQLIMESHDMLHPLNNSRRLSPDENGGNDAGFRRKEFYLNNPPPRSSSAHRIEGGTSSKKVKRDDKTFEDYYGSTCPRGGNGSDLKRCSEGALAPANLKSSNKSKESIEMQSRCPDAYAGRRGDGQDMHQPDGAQSLSAENKLRKVKLKVGGVTRTIHAKSNLEAGNDGTSAKPPRSSDAFRHRQRLSPQDNSDDHSFEMESRLQGDAWKDSSGVSFSRGEGISGKQTDKLPGISSSEPVRKSKRVPKRRVLDDAFDDGEEDDEIRYLEKLKISKVSVDQTTDFEDTGEDGIKKRKISKLSKNRSTPYEVDEDYVMSRSNKEGRKKSRSERESDDTDYVEEEEPGSDGGPEAKRRKQKVSIDSPADVRTEPLTTRQRALQSGKGGNGESLIEFPNGLPPASRKQKEKLSEVEIQAKKAEAAQRRKMQVEKAARESEAEAIRKILGLDSDKRKEEKKQKEREEKAKAAKSQTLASSTIKWVMGPTGTVVIFPEDVGLPSMFSSKSCRKKPYRANQVQK